MFQSPNNGAALRWSRLGPFQPLGPQGAVRPPRALFTKAHAQSRHRTELGATPGLRRNPDDSEVAFSRLKKRSSRGRPLGLMTPNAISAAGYCKLMGVETWHAWVTISDVAAWLSKSTPASCGGRGMRLQGCETQVSPSVQVLCLRRGIRE